MSCFYTEYCSHSAMEWSKIIADIGYGACGCVNWSVPLSFRMSDAVRKFNSGLSKWLAGAAGSVFDKQEPTRHATSLDHSA